MPIPFSKYVQIVSGVAGNAAVATRELMGRLFTTNTLVPPSTTLIFQGGAAAALQAVLDYFGAASVEYSRALFYFTFVSKSITQAKSISFSRWVNAATAPLIWGNKTAKSLTVFQNITAGTFTLELGGVSHTFGPLSFAADASFAAVATRVQNAINAISGTLWSAATVSYDASTNRFNFQGGVAGECAISVTEGVQNLAATLGWLTGAILADGGDQETPVEAVSNASNKNNNYGSFLFLPTLTLDEQDAVSAWNAAQNVAFQDCVRVSAANAEDWSEALLGYAGTGLTLAPLSGEYPEMCEMILLAATDYARRGAVQNYMYQVFSGLTPSVENGPDSDFYDALRVNYYGSTMQGGQNIEFYQRGFLCGGITAPVDMNTYANEQWLKDRAGVGIMTLLLAENEIPANSKGRGMLLAQLQTTIAEARFNGVISIGKVLTTAQQLAVTNVTGDPNAWRQVQNSGYWLDCSIVPYTNNGVTEYKAIYTLVYSKDDTVRKVEGSHVLI